MVSYVQQRQVATRRRGVQVLQMLAKEERLALSTLQLREKARDFALATIEDQRAGFQRFGVWADWDEPYVTLQPEYEAAQLGVFGQVRSAATVSTARARRRALELHRAASLPAQTVVCLAACQILEQGNAVLSEWARPPAEGSGQRV
jgi:tRNA synthetases class I (I, L, M and V)